MNQCKKCKNCGSLDFYKSGPCKPCHNKAKLKWQSENPEKMQAARDRWRAANKAREYKASAIWRSKHPDKVKAWQASWNNRNLKTRVIHQQNREARKRANNEVLSKDISNKLLHLQRGKCACCKKPLDNEYQLDHIMPIFLNGPNNDKNIQLLCPTCNHSKHSKHPIDFMQSRGFLL